MKSYFSDLRFSPARGRTCRFAIHQLRVLTLSAERLSAEPYKRLDTSASDGQTVTCTASDGLMNWGCVLISI